MGSDMTYRECRTKVTLPLDERAHLALAVHRGARRELAALFERHDCFDEGTDGLVRMVWVAGCWSRAAAGGRRGFAAGKRADAIAVEDAGSCSALAGGGRSRA